MITYGNQTVSIEELDAFRIQMQNLLSLSKKNKVPLPCYGICRNMERMQDGYRWSLGYRLTYFLSKNWEHNTEGVGNFNFFPVPDNKDIPLWEGYNLDMRQDFLEYMIKRIRDTIRRAKKNGKAVMK